MRRFTDLLCLTVLLSSLVETTATETGYYMYSDFWCAVYPGEPERMEFLVDWYFNKEFTMQYNSTVGKWTGFTLAGLTTAALFNEDPKDAQQRKLEKQAFCVENIGLVLNITKRNMAEPSISLQAMETTSSSHDTLLVCSAYDFYPPKIMITWYQNGQVVTAGVTLSDVMTNGDWTYQAHSYLEFTSGQQSNVACVVEHPSLKKPRIYEWDTSLPISDRIFVIVGVFALVFGALVLVCGRIQYRRNHCDPELSYAL